MSTTQILSNTQAFSRNTKLSKAHKVIFAVKSTKMEIRFLKSEEIDKTKWNSCVHYANNGNVFGYKWYLDAIAREWDALVEGDYESVMPLPYKLNWRKEKQVYQPDMMRELGIYSINVLSQSRIEAFINAIPQSTSNIEVHLNEQNQNFDFPKLEKTELSNHQYLLEPAYEEMANAFQRDFLLKLEQAEQADLMPTSSLKPETIAAFYLKHSESKNKQANSHAMQRIMYNALHRGWGFASGVQNRQGELLAANFFVYSHHKVISLVPVESPEGKQVEAMAHLFNTLLRSHENKVMILDFNGATEDIAQAIGAKENVYYKIATPKSFLSGIFK